MIARIIFRAVYNHMRSSPLPWHLVPLRPKYLLSRITSNNRADRANVRYILGKGEQLVLMNVVFGGQTWEAGCLAWPNGYLCGREQPHIPTQTSESLTHQSNACMEGSLYYHQKKNLGMRLWLHPNCSCVWPNWSILEHCTLCNNPSPS